MGELVVVLITAPKGEAPRIARTLVEERLAACVNIVGGIRSFYWWQGKVEDDQEDLMIVKTKKCLLDKLMTRVKEIHPYTVPEIVAIDTFRVSGDYEKWALQETLPCE